jgi:hypothetical protein
MSYLPGQTYLVRDGGMGVLSNGAVFPVVFGHCSAGTANSLYLSNNQNSLRDTLGQGQAVELALPLITKAGGVLVMKTAASTAGVAGAVTKTAIGASTGTVTVAGAPYDAYQVRVRIKATGALGVARFDYTRESLAAAPSYSEEITVPAGGTYAIPNTNLTLTFVPGGGPTIFENGDSHAFSCTAPQYTTADLATAFAAFLLALGKNDVQQVHFTGRSSSGAAAATMAATIATQMGLLEARHRWARGVMDAGNDTGPNVKTAFASFASTRVAVVFGTADIVTLNVQPGWGTPRFSAAFAFSERVVGCDLSENPGRVASGNLSPRVRSIQNDENLSQSFLEADKINTLRTHDGEDGFYTTNGYLKSASGSDFIYWDWGRVVDRACRVCFETLQPWLLRKVRILTDGTGRIDPRDAVRIEKAVTSQLRAALKGPTVEGVPDMDHVSDLLFKVDLTNDVKSTRQTLYTLQLVPTIPIENQTTSVGLTGSLAA